MSVSAEFVIEKATKNTFKFAEDPQGKVPIMNTAYVQKHVFGGTEPSRIRITIEVLE